MIDYPYKEYSFSISSALPLEMHNINDRPSDYFKEISSETKTEMKGAMVDAKSWLPMAAEEYNISAKLSDYIVIPVVIMPSDLPNRNGIAFPYRQLTKFNTETGCLGYKTWKGQPTHYEHQNSDHTIAKGVVFESSLRPIRNSNGKLWKVMCLLGFDRNRDSVLANKILTKEISTYSMGAYLKNYTCSICGCSPRDGGCEHVELKKPHFKTFSTKQGEKLAYYNVEDIKGFEVSAVKVPAYLSASNPEYMRMWDE